MREVKYFAKENKGQNKGKLRKLSNQEKTEFNKIKSNGKAKKDSKGRKIIREEIQTGVGRNKETIEISRAGYVNEKKGYVAYRTLNPDSNEEIQEIVEDSQGNIVSNDIKSFWRTI